MTFSDVPESHPFYAAIEALFSAGIMLGELQKDGSRKFYPDRPISRGEFAVVMDRLNIADALKGYVQQ